MSIAEFIGDEVGAAAYRLCGVISHVADKRTAASLIGQARERGSLVLIDSSTARYLRNTELETLLASISPPVLVVPDVRGRSKVPDIALLIHKQLGMLE